MNLSSRRGELGGDAEVLELGIVEGATHGLFARREHRQLVMRTEPIVVSAGGGSRAHAWLETYATSPNPWPTNCCRRLPSRTRATEIPSRSGDQANNDDREDPGRLTFFRLLLSATLLQRGKLGRRYGRRTIPLVYLERAPQQRRPGLKPHATLHLFSRHGHAARRRRTLRPADTDLRRNRTRRLALGRVCTERRPLGGVVRLRRQGSG